jgi:hypothetical protein
MGGREKETKEDTTNGKICKRGSGETIRKLCHFVIN